MLVGSFGPFQVIRYGVWERDDGGPMLRKDGSLAEFVVVLDEKEAVWQLTLAPEFRGERPAAAAEVYARGRCILEDAVRYSQTGRANVARKQKWQVIEFQERPPGPSVKEGGRDKAAVAA